MFTPAKERKDLATRLLTKYPERIPVIVRPGNDSAPPIARHKFLVPSDITFYRFVYEIRKHIQVRSEEAIFVFCNGTIPVQSLPMSTIYQRFRNEDGFLYVTYARENIFG